MPTRGCFLQQYYLICSLFFPFPGAHARSLTVVGYRAIRYIQCRHHTHTATRHTVRRIITHARARYRPICPSSARVTAHHRSQSALSPVFWTRHWQTDSGSVPSASPDLWCPLHIPPCAKLNLEMRSGTAQFNRRRLILRHHSTWASLPLSIHECQYAHGGRAGSQPRVTILLQALLTNVLARRYVLASTPTYQQACHINQP